MSGEARALPSLLLAGAGPQLRDAVGRLLSRSRRADFALGRIRLSAIDLLPQELTGLERCRVLIGRLDAATLLDAAADARRDPAGRRRLAVLRELAGSGSLDVRSAGAEAWTPDFSVYRGPDGPTAALVGAHWFHTAPATGASLTCLLRSAHDPAGPAALAERFETLWRGGHDVLDVVREALDVGAQAPAAASRHGAPRVGEPRAAWRGEDGATGAGESGADTDPAVAVARRIADACFAGPTPIARPFFRLAAFQAEAAARAEALLRRRRGVVIADGVGLGKTYIALALIEKRLREGGSVAVVIPAAMRGQWREPLRRLCASLRLPPPTESGDGDPIRVFVVSHRRLGREPADTPRRPRGLRDLRLVVVDEAHAFRNPATNRYRALAELCRGVPVALLTATPVNNSPLDLYWLLRLFAGDADFADVGVADLGAAFREAAGEDGEPLPAAVRPAVRAVTIRRTRPFLREHYGDLRLPGAGAPLAFPRREPPRAVSYSLDDAGAGTLDRIGAELDGFEAAAYAGIGDEGASQAPVTLLRLLLLKRLESGAAAFRLSVARLLRFHDAALRAVRQGRLPEAPASAEPGDGDPLQLRLDALLLRPLPGHVDRDALEARIRQDRDRLRGLLSATSALDGREDPKLRALGMLLDAMDGRKVIIFTGYRDTARRLHRQLLGRGRVGLIDGEGARIGASRCARIDVIRRFAPAANRAPAPPQAQRVDILVATDVLAEGLNLQDAADVVSYDLPWNPVRLVQRVGRVDRLGSRHATVRAWYFLPEPRLERMLRIAHRLRGKIAAIRGTIGADQRILPAAADPFPADVVRRLRAGDDAVLDDIERTEAASFEPEERLRAELLAGLARGGGEPAPDQRPTLHAWARSDVVSAPHVLVALTVRDRAECVIVGPDGQVRRDDGRTLRLLAAVTRDRRTRGPDRSGPGAENGSMTDGAVRPRGPGRPTAAGRRAIAAALAWASAHEAAGGPQGGEMVVPAPRHSGQRPFRNGRRRAASRLLRALAEEPAPAPALCRRVDALLARLGRDGPAADELALRAALRRLPPAYVAPAAAVAAALEEALGVPESDATDVEAGGAEDAAADVRVRVLASLELRPAGG